MLACLLLSGIQVFYLAPAGVCDASVWLQEEMVLV